MIHHANDLTAFETIESGVRSYIRQWPAVFTKAQGHLMWDEEGKEYIDLFAGAGTLNYGHNHPALKEALLEYLANDNVVHGLDMGTAAKRAFLEAYDETILKPRGLDYVIQFPGPTGTNAVEAALKLARKVTGRDWMISFTNAFHGMTLGSLALTGNDMKRGGGGVPLQYATSMPYDGFFDDDQAIGAIDYLRMFLAAEGSGLDAPAAIIVETVQGEGGVNVASMEFLRDLRRTATEYGALLIVDDIQMGNGRTGKYFSWEDAGIQPDIVCISKSISGYGLPMALTLFRKDLDIWGPGEHNGTFRGNNPAFVTATKTLETFWQDDALTREVESKAVTLCHRLEAIAEEYPEAEASARGRGLIQGLHSGVEGLAQETIEEAFRRGVIAETSGPTSDVVKFLPSLTIPEDELLRGVKIIEESLHHVLVERGLRSKVMATAGRQA
ncbi:MAG: diaminobutyrate--2-oxoglutarate transaminase [Dehalococcoidia bacterium]|nr:diaminobutyrate--2-oxoglutarate transaminase [Dehalococcoidia bacterium]